MTDRNIDLRVPTLARVEGEGALKVTVDDGTVTDLELEIYEPPRFFEAFLRGRDFAEPIDITARICGICPVAYQTSAANALERIAGVTVDGPLRELRRLLYAGEWIESHVLHVGFLHAPDFLGADSGIELAGRHPDLIEMVLQLKKVGNDIMELVGGRPIHPVNLRLGGFHRVFDPDELRALDEPLRWAHEAAVELARWTAGFDFPDLMIDHEFVSLRHPTEYAVVDGRVVSDRGLDIDPSSFDDEFVEEHVGHSTALHGRRRDGSAYLTGPLARWANNHDRLPTEVRELADELGVPAIERNPYRSIVVRSLETLLAVIEAQRIVEAYERPEVAHLPVTPRAGVGCGVSEAPRGVLYHRYTTADDGTITSAMIVPPTAQNQPVIEADLLQVVQTHLADPIAPTGRLADADDALRHRCEMTVRNYDPCISCAAHFLSVEITDAGAESDDAPEQDRGR